MQKKEKLYITTAIFYINGEPHVGSVYEAIAADVIARAHRLLGYDVFFLTGTDENSIKGVKAAEAKKMDVKQYIDEMAATWREVLLGLKLSFDRFIRTTSPEHRKAVELFYERVKQNGDLYEADYNGFYCEGCEAFITEKDLVNGNCPYHLTKPKKIKESNIFFRASKYKEAILKHIEHTPGFIEPESRKNEIVQYITNHFEDISITRQSMAWGIPAPDNPEEVIYVWFDALINYLSGVGYAVDNDKFGRFWPADIHFVGKDIIKFHCALWPAMLLSAGLPLPKKIFAHGFLTAEGKKISKSLGNTIDPIAIRDEFGNDALRYFLLREISYGQDGDFSFERLRQRYASDLANDYGNLVSRFAQMAEKFLRGKVDPIKTESVKDAAFEKIRACKFHEALELVWQRFAWANGFIDSEKPWELAKDLSANEAKLKEILGKIRFTLVDCAAALEPIMPDSSKRVLELLDVEKIEKVETSLFPRLSDE